VTTSRPTILLWTNEADVYRRALATAGLAERVEVEAARLDAHPDPAVLARCEGLLAWRAAPGLLARMPRLRWIQGITVLPHIGGLHPTRDELVAELFVDNVARFLDDQPLRAVVDRARGY
jgi:phosphoglycerate dehydrogenase-like enzyme